MVTTLVLTAILGSGALAGSAAGLNSTVALADEVLNAPVEAGSIRIELDPRAYRRLWDGAATTVERFPLPDGQRVDLELRPFQVLAPGALVINVDADGVEQRVDPAIRFVRGTIVGDAASAVVLALFQNRIAGVVKSGNKEFGVGPVEFSIDRPQAMELRVWDREAEPGDWSCAVSHEESKLAASLVDFDAIGEASDAPLSHQGGAQLLLELAVDSTTEWCAHFGNDATAAQNYLLTLVAQISAIYDAEVLELIQVPYLRTFCGAADPYTAGLGAGSPLLSELTAEWTANQSSVARTVTHLFTKSSTASASGFANTFFCSGSCQSVLCNNSFGYGVTALPAAGGAPASFEVAVAAHELGHNHSSPHTNCLQDARGDWQSTCAINSCGANPWCQTTGCYSGPVNTAMTGTIMSSSCDSRISVFDDFIVEFILRSSAEAASCIEGAALPGDVREQTGSGLRLALPVSCPVATLQNDDGAVNGAYGANGTSQLAWIKRFTPACYPFRLNRVDALISNSSVAVGRPIRLLVYADPTGSGNPANATLVHTEDVTVQTVSSSTFNQYTLATAVTLDAGDLYLGFYDLLSDAPNSFIASTDSSTSGDSWRAFNTTSPTSYVPHAGATWMIRGQGGPVAAGSVALSWGPPCNAAEAPDQDYGVYRGDIGNFTSYSSLTCSTNRATSYFAEGVPDGSFFLVVPQTTPVEGSYGQMSSGSERPAAAIACKPQDAALCP